MGKLLRISNDFFFEASEPILLKFHMEKKLRKVQGVQQSQTAALPRPQEEEETDKYKQAQTEQTHEKHQDQPPPPQARQPATPKGASLGWGNKQLLNWSRSVDQDGRHDHIW